MAENLKKIAKESEKKGFEKIMNWYKKFNDNVDKTLSKMIDEKEEQKFGLIDIYKWFKKKFTKVEK